MKGGWVCFNGMKVRLNGLYNYPQIEHCCEQLTISHFESSRSTAARPHHRNASAYFEVSRTRDTSKYEAAYAMVDNFYF